MACNLLYAHLTRDLTHGEKCDLERGICAADCRWAGFHEWLTGPLLPSDADELARQRERHAALLRGDIPA